MKKIIFLIAVVAVVYVSLSGIQIINDFETMANARYALVDNV